ncbi:cation diffusion facilitator family transporter [Paenibacillus eucommiae]|uniref:Cation diffusion facilitator family transporter n=1 Tax=Paenibacillus eucommiae TaxID=1355755 RepID=A0ABS4JA89_9BACL|nr:cation diffusion facilitator family transporter [Paenibacillus eucommiae]MBP1996758.1 cation diffusion facilitator family transporter [Paenibacillus eucommiae]
MIDKRFQKAAFAVWIGIASNIVLAVLKGFVGITAGSKALLADAIHSASNVAGSFTALVSIRAAKLSADEDRPYGHGKAEAVASILISVLLLIIGIELGVSAVKALWAGVDSAPPGYALGIIVISLVVKEIIFRYKYHAGKQTGSQITNFRERRFDIISALFAVLGVSGALIGTYWDLPFFFYFDPAAGLFISLLILKKGYNLVRETIHKTLYQMLHQEDAAELINTVQRVKGVISVDDLTAREHGHYVIVDMKISVNPKISVLEGHDIARLAKQQLMKRFIHITDVYVRVNPYDPGYPYKNNMDSEHDDYPTLVH